ncbi:uncharacterized protein LOC115890832 [Sitophilus oryzae]|uniref:Uncharacterized protein LOC115890832 n=1 Tax=Sitophilus oryzae TaxID=7048 RepID=A0A6J2YVZ9_SITOR|nr:uncharacterized protein LOC115890832 [Sitophilus oryzae]
MPFKWKSKGRTKYSPDDLKRAVLEIVNENKALRTTARKYNVDKMTLKRYISKYKEDKSITFSPNFVTSQIFSPHEESLLMEYLLTSADLYYGLTPKQTRKFAYQFGQENQKKIPENWRKNECASYDWLKGFMSRHPQLSLRSPEGTSLGRATAFNRHNVQEFYKNLRNLMEREPFGPESIYNLDETGVTTAHKPEKIIARKGQKQISKTISAERGTLVTVCCAINALGNSVPPFFIFPRVRLQEYMIHGAPPGSIAVTHESGWMTADNFVKYLDHFIKYAKCSKENKCILVLDNHDSHISPKALNTCKLNGIHLLTLPPHTSHRLQPLDVSVFGPFKKYYNEQADAWMVSHPGQTISLKNIPALVGLAYVRAFSPSNITKGFSTTGIYPFNPHLFEDLDFAGAEVTNRPYQEVGQNPEEEPVIDDPIAQPGTSSSQLEPTFNTMENTTTIQSTPSAPFKSPEEVRPYPKALPRKKKGGRKLGRTRILTDTPEKQAIEAEFNSREEKKRMKTKIKQVKRKISSETRKSDTFQQHNVECSESYPKRKVLDRNRETERSVYVDSNSESENEKDPFSDTADDDDAACIYCNSLFSASRSREKWIRCQQCLKWCHSACAGVNNNIKTFTCELCID